MRHMMRHSRRSLGMAIGVILMAIALVTTLGIALSASMRGGGAVSETNSQAMWAAAILNQAALIRSGLIVTQAKDGVLIEKLHLNTVANNYDATGAGLFNPVDGAGEPQTPPAGAVTSSSTGWRWWGDNWTGSVCLPGYSNCFYPITLSYLQQGVCAQINQSLNGAPTIPVITASWDLQTTTGVQAMTGNSNFTSLSGMMEGCFQDSRGVYQYFKNVVDDSA